MPEGHTIHRAARDHHRRFADQKLVVVSPQGRFASGASLISGQECFAVEAFGKHLIYHFDEGLALHVHLGLFGRIREHKLPMPEPRGAVRVRIVGDTHAIDVNGPTVCEVIDRQQLKKLCDRIGPDVLRSDADPDLAFKKISKSKVSIGQLLMDQSVMSGIGNIYRSEILWRQAVHPKTPGQKINRKTFDLIWEDAKALLALGVKYNAIITVSGVRPSGNRRREKVNIFGKGFCPTCRGTIHQFEINSRRVFACENCQKMVT